MSGRYTAHLQSLGNAARKVFLLLALFSCGKSEPPPAPLTDAFFVRPLQEEVTEWDDYPARLESPDIVTLSARVSGVVTQAPFKEGSLVRAGDILFVIDERPFAADLQNREAAILSAQAQLEQAQAQFKRYDMLKGTKAVSAADYDQTAANMHQAAAAVEAAKAARDIAKLNLEWTRVLSPISGKVSRKFVTEGNLISGGPGQATPLTVITSVTPMYCYASAPERALLKYRALAAEREESGRGELPCKLRLENEKNYGFFGKINFVDNRVDEATGTVELRCSVDNSSGYLSSGLFARMRVLGSSPEQAILIPDEAIGTDQASRFVLVIDPGDVIVRKPVELGSLLGTLRSIKKGVEPGDRIIAAGLQKLRPGEKASPKEVQISPEAKAALKEYQASEAP